MADDVSERGACFINNKILSVLSSDLPVFLRKLLEDGKINPAQAEEAIKIQKSAGGFYGMILVNMGAIDEDTLMKYLEKNKS